ncbi:MalY/PatB family protein [Granulosicoccus sp. 3-233]|uniref:MalY/PatB family protein n=1 Tax=Granulosicoccus sp. 3-233 TaxID=3417969 RepID=UPI003D336F28
MIDFDKLVARTGTASLKWDRYKGRDILPFWVADMDFEVAPPIQQALEERLQHPVYGYTVPPEGMADAVIAHLQNEHDWQVDPDWIVWLPGVVPGLAVCCRAFCPDGDEIVVNPPIYHHFYDSHDLERQSVVRVPLHKVDGRWTYDMPAMEAAFNDKTRLMMMCSPHNPTGTVFTREELNALADLCRRHDVIMVSDEIHSDLVIDPGARHYPTAKACPSMADAMVTLMSGSKTWNIAGLNCSFAIISNPTLRERFRSVSQSIVSPVPPLAYTATLAAYRDGGPWRQELLDYLAGNFDCIRSDLAEVQGLTVEPIQATYLAWIDATGLGLEDTQGFFEEHGVGLSGGEQFGQSQYLRMNFACPRESLRAGLDRMKAAVASLSREPRRSSGAL